MELENRDPNDLSKHLQVAWEDVVGEPPSIRSPECAWSLSNQCFNNSRNFCYVLLSVLCAPVAACCLGCTFAWLSFEHIWCVTPCLRVWKVRCSAVRNFVAACAAACVIPCTTAFGFVFSEIRAKWQRIPVEEIKKDDVWLA